MVPQNLSDQHDTVALRPQAHPAAVVSPGLGTPAGSSTDHPTVVLPAPVQSPRPAQAPAAAPALAPAVPAPVGWQGVAQWRDSMVQQAPTAWSQLPPFIPTGPPVLVQRNNAAVVGATLGSVSLFLSLLPLIGIVAWLLAPIGLLTSTVGLFVGMARKVGRVGALWGMATSGLALGICLAWTALFLAF